MEAAATHDHEVASNDLGPLAWVLEELRKSLESASSALRRFVRDTAQARGEDMASIDTGQLRIARQHMHQAVGALEMVGLAAPAHMLRGMEAAAQKFVERPELCTEQAAAKVERAGFALTEYLEALLGGKSVSPLSLFPQYKDVQDLCGSDRIHPADLWSMDWRWIEPQVATPGEPLQYDPAVRSKMDQAVLRIVKSADPAAGRELAHIALQLGASQTARQPKAFWKIAAGYFEAIALSLLPADLYVKRAASRILLQYASLAKGDLGVSDRLAQDLVFFCSQGVPPNPADAPALTAVRQAYNLTRSQRVDYSVSPFGRFDPLLLTQARKRIAHAKENWSGLSGGDANKLKGSADLFHMVCDSLVKLYPPSETLAKELGSAIDYVVRSGRPPSAELAMEVATAILYLEAAFQDLDPNDQHLAERTVRLAERLNKVVHGGQPEPLEHWVEELYRRVSDKQTMGSVVGELRGTLGELEKVLDNFFRNTVEKGALREAPGFLQQMKGVLSVLGLDHATHAVQHMRETIESIVIGTVEVEEARANGTFDRLGNNLGALGFLIDMLNYQPALAKKLFTYVEATGELKPLMGRAEQPHAPVEATAPAAPVAEAPSTASMPAAHAMDFNAPPELLGASDTIARSAAAAPVLDPLYAPEPTIVLRAPVVPEPTFSAEATQPLMPPMAAPAPAAAVAAPTPAAPAPAPAAEEDDGEAELREIFLEEAREVVQNGLNALATLADEPSNLSELTTLRRAFHTLKGSSRMVGLSDFGEGAWSMEQVLNTWLADQKHANDPMRQISTEALKGFGRWIEDIAANVEIRWKSSMFRGPADAFRTEGRLVPFAFPGAADAAPAAVPEAPAEVPAAEAAPALEPVAELPPAVELPAVEAPALEPVAELPAAVELPAVEAAPALEPLVAEVPAAPVLEMPALEMPALDLAPPMPEPAPALEAAPALDMPSLELPPAESLPVAQPEPVPSLDDLSFAPLADATPSTAAAPVATPPEFSMDFAAATTPEVAPAVETTPALELPSFDVPSTEPVAEATPAAEPSALELPAFDEPAADANFGSTQVIRDAAPEVSEIPLDELPPEFSLELGVQPAPVQPAEQAPAEIAGIDFSSLAELSTSTTPTEEAPKEATADVLPPLEPAAPAQAFVSAEFVAPEAEPVEAPALSPAEIEASAFAPMEPAASETSIDDQVKVIGPLRIGIPLYNVYLNEADEWSRRLQNEIGEWALDMTQPIPDSTVGWAHALAGSSATVGFTALSDVARVLEHTLQHTQKLAYTTPGHGEAFTRAAEEVRRLLHQFAAGFLKEPDARVSEALQALQALDIPLRDVTEESFESDSGFVPMEPVAELPPVEEPAPAPVVAPPAEIAAPVMFVAPTPVAAPVPVAPVAAARGEVEGEDEDFDVVDAIDPDLFPIFEEEGAELMPVLGSALRQWAARPDHKEPRTQVLRALHTLKGSARLAGALRLGELAHRLESEVEYLGSEGIAAADIEALLHRFDVMQARFDTLRATGGVAPPEPVAAAPVQPVAPVATAPVEEIAPATPVEPFAAFAPATPQAESVAQAPAEEAAAPAKPVAQPVRAAIAMPAQTTVTAARQSANQAVRVRAQLLDRLVNQAGEVMITRSRLEAELRQLRGSLQDLTGNLDRLRSQLRDIELQAESQMQSRLAQAKDTAAGFDPLEFDRFTRVQELTRMMAESVNDVATVQRNIQRVVEATEDDLIAQARQTRELQRDLLRTRMVEFEGISDRLYRVVRLAAKESGKQVKLDILGGTIEMDRGVLDRMTPAFEHLLRNCVAHGVETPEVRKSAAKDPTGSIAIHVRQEGNDVSVEFQDDGAGLNLARIREKALQQNLITPDQTLSEAEAANLIFLPGFSTAAQVTELAGRGIGMDVVRNEVNALGGRIETTTQPGLGTSFKLVLPLTTAVTQVVMIRSGKLAIGVPANLVEIVRRATVKEVDHAYESGQFDFAGEHIPFFWSGALLQSSTASHEPQGKTLPVVIFRSAAQRIAVHVDEVLGNQEVVVKNLGPQLSRLPGLAGMTVLASGAVVLIYNPVALTQVYGEKARQVTVDARKAAEPAAAQAGVAGQPVAPVAPKAPAAPSIPLVLVVDDSITVRRVTQRLLQREGYRVALAADGLQALERLAEERPTVVLSDIEMPRMDGFDLARNIRGDARLANLPIVMITSRIAEKHREHARELGVNHYLGKPYSEEELLGLVKQFVREAVTA